MLGWSYHPQRWSCSWQEPNPAPHFPCFIPSPSSWDVICAGQVMIPWKIQLWNSSAVPSMLQPHRSGFGWAIPSAFRSSPNQAGTRWFWSSSGKLSWNSSNFFPWRKGCGISVFLMGCNYLIPSLTELGFSRQMIMAVIAKGSFAGAGAARCNGTLL